MENCSFQPKETSCGAISPRISGSSIRTGREGRRRGRGLLLLLFFIRSRRRGGVGGYGRRGGGGGRGCVLAEGERYRVFRSGVQACFVLRDTPQAFQLRYTPLLFLLSSVCVKKFFSYLPGFLRNLSSRPPLLNRLVLLLIVSISFN